MSDSASHLISEHFNRLADHGGPVEKGIFCDVVETLYGPSYGFQGNKPLIEFLNDQHAKGVKVTVFSSDPGGLMGMVLEDMGLAPALAENIRHKKEFKGKTLELVIDDMPPDYFKMVTHLHPHHGVTKQFLNSPVAKHALKR